MRWKKQKNDQPRRRQLSEQQRNADKEQQGLGAALFKRNRTLTGSSSTTINSATELSGDLRSPRVHAHHLTAHRRRLSTVLIAVLVIIGSLLWFLYEFTAGIRAVPVSSSIMLDESRYQKTIGEYYASRPIERLRILTNEKTLGDYVRHELPEVESVRVDGSAGFATSRFVVTPRQPLAGWLIGSAQYYVDASGIAFQTNYYEQPTVRITDQSGVPQTAGTTVASSRFLSFVGRSVAVAKTYGLAVEQAIIPANSTRQIELRVAGRGYPIKLSLDRPVGEQVEDMQRAVAYFDAKKINPQYIDVRVSGKAFYR